MLQTWKPLIMDKVSLFDFINLAIGLLGAILGIIFYCWRKEFQEKTRLIQARPIFQYVDGGKKDTLDNDSARETRLEYRFDITFRNVGEACFYFDSFPKENDEKGYGIDQYEKSAIVGSNNDIILKFFVIKKQEKYFFNLQFRDGYENLYKQQVIVRPNNKKSDVFEFIVGPPKLIK